MISDLGSILRRMGLLGALHGLAYKTGNKACTLLMHITEQPDNASRLQDS